jgi:hypothetical protein
VLEAKLACDQDRHPTATDVAWLILTDVQLDNVGLVLESLLAEVLVVIVVEEQRLADEILR